MPTPEAIDTRALIARLAHQLRNPLATLKSGLQLAQRLTRPEGDLAEALEAMLPEIGRIDRLLRRAQQYVALEPPGLPPPRTDVGEAAAAVAARRWPAADRTIAVEGGPACTVGVGARDLELALAELLANAVRFAPAGTLVRVRWSAAAGGVAIEVADEGPGIAPHILDKLPAPYHSTDPDATGMGIAIASRIAGLAGGRLAWHSAPGAGARFTLLLPGS
ncbi:MAG: HAMP domain-containing histidine kinase [Acidobacteria bacterium]|nr:HAMP domain-containing histidine kinase [Acidobacteriota bacterium]